MAKPKKDSARPQPAAKQPLQQTKDGPAKKKPPKKKLNAQKTQLLVGAMDSAFVDVQHAQLTRAEARRLLASAKGQEAYGGRLMGALQGAQVAAKQAAYQQQQAALHDVISTLGSL